MGVDETKPTITKAPGKPKKRTKRKKDGVLDLRRTRGKSAKDVFHFLYYEQRIADNAKATFTGDFQRDWLGHVATLVNDAWENATPDERERCQVMADGHPDPWKKPEGVSSEEYGRVVRLDGYEQSVYAT